MATAVTQAPDGETLHKRTQGVTLPTPAFTGGALEAMWAKERQICLDGPAGTGKSYMALWKFHLRAMRFPGSRHLLARKTLISLKSSTLVTYKQQVLGPLYDMGYVKFHTAQGDEPAHYAYWNGSKMVITGLDKPGKAMSTEYDGILVDEALDTEEDAIEMLTTRIQRPGHLYGVPGRPPYAQVVLVTNPGPPRHWLNLRMNAGRTRRILSRHQDNPAMTEEYLETLRQTLTGARRGRLLFGLWVAAEGAVYEDEYDAAIHVIKPFDIPQEWPRYWSIDWGYTNPFVCQFWAVDPDGRLYMYREVYMSKKTVLDHATYIQHRFLNKEPLPRAIIADTADPEAREQFTRVLGLNTVGARKNISNGISLVKDRLLKAGDNKPRLYIFKDCVDTVDMELERLKLPTSTVEEFDGYVWAETAKGALKEEPIDLNNHGMDAMRYMVAQLDTKAVDIQYADIPW